MKSWYVVHPAPCNKMSKPALYCVSDNGCFVDDVVVLACCLRACFRESRVAIAVRHVCGYLALVMAAVVDVRLIEVNGRALGRVWW
jgi:hypothetical protein